MNRIGEPKTSMWSRLRAWWRYYKGLVYILVTAVAIGGGLVFAASMSAYHACVTRGEMLGHKTKWHFFGGCFHQSGNSWYLQSQQMYTKEMD